MRRINFNQRPTTVARGSSRATYDNSIKRMWELVSTVSAPSGFSDLICSESVVNPLSSSEPLSCASSGVSHNATARIAASPISVSCRQPDLGVQYHPWSKVDIRGTASTTHSMGREQGWDHLSANPGFGVFWFIPPLLSKTILGQPPLYGGFSLVYTQSRRDLSSCGVYRPKSWCLEGVRIWKLRRTYPGEKPPSFSVLTHRYSLVTRNPTRHLLTIPYILMRIRAPYKGW